MVLVGASTDPTLSKVYENAADHLVKARNYCGMNGREEHRRGGYSTLSSGISRGGGQPVCKACKKGRRAGIDHYAASYEHQAQE